MCSGAKSHSFARAGLNPTKATSQAPDLPASRSAPTDGYITGSKGTPMRPANAFPRSYPTPFISPDALSRMTLWGLPSWSATRSLPVGAKACRASAFGAASMPAQPASTKPSSAAISQCIARMCPSFVWCSDPRSGAGSTRLPTSVLVLHATVAGRLACAAIATQLAVAGILLGGQDVDLCQMGFEVRPADLGLQRADLTQRGSEQLGRHGPGGEQLVEFALLINEHSS